MHRIGIASLSLVLAASLGHCLTYKATILDKQGTAACIAKGIAGGNIASKAVLWLEPKRALSVHPSFLDTPEGRGISFMNDRFGKTSVGFGYRYNGGGHSEAILWQGTTPTIFSQSFQYFSSLAQGTDGQQAVGWTSEIDTNDVGTPFSGRRHAMLWNAQTGAVIADLTGSRNGEAVDVGGGVQVGYVFGSQFAEACLWRGSANSFVSLHPHGMDASQALAADGVFQVGMIATEVRVFQERNQGRYVLMPQAAIWSGTMDSWSYLPYFADGWNYSTSTATDIAGSIACGTGQGRNNAGVIQFNHALAWDLNLGTWTDLHSLLPAGYSSSFAESIDTEGNVAGYAYSNAVGSVPVVWMRQ